MGYYKGVTAVWWCKDLSISKTEGFVALTGDLHVQSVSGGRMADKGELKNSSADVVGEGYANDRYEATLEVIPSGANAGQLATAYALVAPGAKTVLVEQVNSTNTFLSAQAWILDGMDFKGDLTNPRGLTIKLHRFHNQTGVATDSA